MEPKPPIQESTKPGSLWPPIRSAILNYGVAVLSVMMATIILTQMDINLGAATLVALYLCAVMFSSWFGGTGPGLVALAFSGLAFDYFFLPPVNSLAVKATQLPRLGIFVLASFFILALSAAQRRAIESLRHIHDDLKRINQSLVTEIVERTQTEKALRESETKLKEAEQLAQIGYWEHDLIADRITCSEEACRIFGRQSSEGIFNLANLHEMIHPDDLERQQQALSEAIQKHGLYDVEYRIVRPDGDVRWVHIRDEIEYNESGKPIRMFGAVQDITENKRAEDEIRRQAARMEVLAEITHTFQKVGLDYQVVLDTVARCTAELIGDACIVTFFSDDKKLSFPVAFHHRDPKAKALLHETLLNTWQGGIDNQRSQVILAGNAVFIPKADTEEFQNLLEPEFRQYFDVIGISSIIYAPIRVEERVIGTLSITRDRHGVPYTADDQALLQDLADRAALTIQNAQLFEQVQAAQQRLHILSNQLLDAQEVERRTIARELHDDVGQILSGLMMQLGIAKSRLPKSAKSVQNILEGAEAFIQEILERTRLIIAGLRPPVLEDLGLVPALHRLAKDIQQTTGMEVEINTANFPKRLPASLEVALYRIVQEGLTNAQKHAQAHHVNITLEKKDGNIVLSIQDDGLGFEKQPPGPRTSGDMILEGGWRIPEGHFGLIDIQERAAQLGGKLHIMSIPGQGTNLRVELPLSGAEERPDENL